MVGNVHAHTFVPYTGTLTCSTLKSKELDSSKFTCSAADTEAVEGCKTGAIELITHLAHDEVKACEYEVPYSITTKFGETGVKAEGSSARGSL